MPFLVVFVASGQVTHWSEHQDFFDAQFCTEEVPYHTPELGTGHIITECAEHGWRPANTANSVCEDCWDIYFDEPGDKLSNLDAYHEFEWRQDFHEGGL